MTFNQVDLDFKRLCWDGKFDEANELLQKGEVSSEEVFNQAVRYLEENAAFASSCLAYLQKERPDDPYTKALQGVLYVKDKKYKEALELFKSDDISLDAFKHILAIVKERKDKASQSFLINCLDYIDFSSLEENESIPLSRFDIEYLLKLAQQHNKEDFIKSCLASKNSYINKSDILFTLKEDKHFSTYLSEALSQGYLSIDDMKSYINRVTSKTNKKHLKEFFSVLEKSSPETFSSLFYECCTYSFSNSIRNSDDIKLLVESISNEQLIRAIRHARGLNNTNLEEELMKHLTKEKQLQVLSEITGIPLQQGKKKRGQKSSQQTENDALNEILTQLSLGKDENDTVHFCECISELKTFKEEERQFFIAVLRGDYAKAIELAGKIDINKTLGGKTALMYAIDNGSNELVKFLLAQEGLNPLIMDRNERIAHDYERAKKLEEENQQTLEALTDEGKNHANHLFAAVEEHNVDEVTRLLKNGAANLNIQDQEGKPLIVHALELAMAQEDFKIVQVLIEAGVDLNLQGDQSISGYSFLDANVEKIASLEGGIGIEFLKSIPNYSPLISLLTQGRYNAKLIKRMLAERVDINTVCARTNKTALETAISMQPDGRYLNDFERQDFTIAQDLLYMHERDENNVPIIKNPASVLYLAVKKSHVGLTLTNRYAIEPSKILTTLLCNGVDIDAVDENGDTALKKAVLANDFEGVYFLLKYGANPNHPSLKGIEWPGHAKGALNQHNTADRFLSDIKNEDVDTVVRGTPAQAKERFKDEKVNQTYEGYTPLMWAIKYERIDMIKVLLELNPDLKVVSETGMTALDIAAKCKNPYIYFLLDKYAQQDSRTQGLRGVVSQESENLQELFLAIRECDLDRVKKLTDQMPDLNIQDSKGNSPAKLTAELLAAMAMGKDYTPENMKKLGAILLHLQSKGAEITYGTDAGPFMILCKALPETTMGDGTINPEGKTPKGYVLEDIICNVIDNERMGHFDFADDKGNTPLHYAVEGMSSKVGNKLVSLKNEYMFRTSVDIKNNEGNSVRDLARDAMGRYYVAPETGHSSSPIDEFFNSILQRPNENRTSPSTYVPEIRVVSDKPYERIEAATKGDRDFKWVFKNEDKNQINHPTHPTNRVFELLEAYKNEKNEKKKGDIYEEIEGLFRDPKTNIRAVDPKDKKPMIIKVIETGDMDLIAGGILESSRVTAEALLERGPDGRNAIDIAFASETKGLKEWMDGQLKKAGVVLADYKETYAALVSGYDRTLGLIEDALESGKKLDLRVTDNNGKTILHHLAEQGRVDLLEKALQKWVDPDDLSVLTITDNNGKTPLDLLRLNEKIPQEKKNAFVLEYLKKELDKKDKNLSVITELLEQLDEKTLEELTGNEEYQSVHKLIQDQLDGLSQERAKVSALNPQATNAVAVLNDNAERNITTARGADGVDISYTSSRGRA